jgi:hypothetical protein
MLAALRRVIERAITDATFRAQLPGDPDRVLAKYQLTAVERDELLRGGVMALAPLGVDRRVNKIEKPDIPDDAFPTFR